MTIERQISQYDNPQEFARLCNAVFIAKYGDGYQVVDGSREDGGNDGYVSAEKRILAMYCPVKPEQKTDAGYLKKIRSDISKAVTLRDSGSYEIENWTFITPRKLGNDVIATMIAEARSMGLRAVQMDAAFLALEICERPHIKFNFPELLILEFGEYLKTDRTGKNGGDVPGSDNKTTLVDAEKFIAEPLGEPSGDFLRVMCVRESLDIDPEIAKTELRALAYQSTDRYAQLNAIFGITDLFSPLKDDIGDLLALCERGLTIAKSKKSSEAAAILHAFMGFVESIRFGLEEIDYFGQIAMDQAVGMQLFSGAEREASLNALRAKAEQFQREFSMAIEMTKQSGNSRVFVNVLTYFANAAGQRASYLQTYQPERAAKEKALCKKTLLAVKDFCSVIGDPRGVANALFNLANQIRFLGEEKEALLMLPGIRKVAEQYADKGLLLKIADMEGKLRSDKLPNQKY